MILSVLDQSPIIAGRSPDASIRESIALARHCEALGYKRYWVAEHHASDAVAGSAPEILMAAIAATTSRIRVGSAGVMLPHYAPLKVAEQFRVLEAIAPGRIDMGLGRAPGSDGHTAMALNPDAAQAAANFPAAVRDVLAWSSGAPLPENHPYRDIVAQPLGPTAPETWILGSSDYGAQVAAHFGLPYCFAHFITDGAGAEEAIALYRHLYRPSSRHPTPHAAICVWALAAETEAAARRIAQTRELWRLSRDRGRFVPLPTIEQAETYPYTDAERARIERMRAQAIVGSGAQVAARLTALSLSLGADEVAVLTTAPDEEDRRRSYAELAREELRLAA